MSTQEFNELVVSNADSLKPFAISLTRDTDVAEDLCQETLYKAFAYKEKYKPGTNIKAWLYTIMKNVFINGYRRNERRKVVMNAMEYNLRQTTVERADHKLLNQEINTAIYKLPGIFKNVCLLYLQGYKYNEIADTLNEPLGTIKSRIHFARKMLQKQIQR